MSGPAEQLHYRFEGPPGAPVLVLSNSLGTTMRLWDAQLGALRGQFRILRYDQRGHGRSPSPPGPYSIDELGNDLLGLLDRTETDKAHLCGVSLGGMVAMWVAANAPSRVDRLVLACTAAWLGPAQQWSDRATKARSSGTASLVETVLPRWFTPSMAETHPDLVEAIGSDLAGCDDQGYAACCEAIAAMDQRPTLARIGAPTLVIGGGLDPVCPPAMEAELAGAIPGASLSVLAGASHLACVERPERFNSVLSEHLSGDRT